MALICALLTACSPASVETVVVALVDGSVNNDLPAFRGYSIERLTNRAPDPHGTMMASLVLGVIDAEPLSPENVELLSYDVMSRETSGREAMAAAIIDATARRATVILITSGFRQSTSGLEAAISQATGSGAVVIAAAGNTGRLPADYPARLPGVVSVGALDTDGTPWRVSAQTGVTAWERGVDVRALDDTGHETVVSGTSAAAALVVHELVSAISEGRSATASDYVASRE